MKQKINTTNDFLNVVKKNKLFKHKIYLDVDISKYCTIAVGGTAAVLIEIDNHKELLFFLKNYELTMPVFFMGLGSKILFSDSYMKCIIFRFIEDKELVLLSDEYVLCFSGTKINNLIGLTYKNELSGFEYLTGVPGNVGGSIVMNAGTSKGTISDIVECVIASDLDGNIMFFSKEDCLFSYRNSIFRQRKEYMIIYVLFKLKKSSKKNIKKNILQITHNRGVNQPQGKSFGSVFCNPKKYPAGWLIENVGLKGFSINDAAISEKHANFILNKGEAKFEDIKYLIELAKEKVYKKYGIILKPEVEIFKIQET
jgi:UDP-N-acetylmuramate dehydrogenase